MEFKTFSAKPRKRSFLGLWVACLSVGMLFITAASFAQSKVTIKEDAETYTMDNGLVQARVSKVTGDLVSFRYKNMEMFETKLTPDVIPQPRGTEPANNPNWKSPQIGLSDHGYWSHDTKGVTGSAPAIPSVTIDPAKNGGAIAEVSVKAISKGRKMGTGPGTGKDGDLTVDIDIRYTLQRGSSGVYTYCIFDHLADYPWGAFGEARFCTKLAPFFDWMSIDKEVDRQYLKGTEEGDKYIFTANQNDNRAWGWSSTTKNVGVFFINASMEYMSGGPTKMELSGHRNTDANAAPCILNYWRSSHYGGAVANIAAGEKWGKVIGPFMIYANSGADHKAIYDNAKAQAVKEAAKWPYNWVDLPADIYPQAKDRSTVKGKFVINDPLKPASFKGFNVGLTNGDYISPSATPGTGPQVMTSWQKDGKYYQFWAKGNADGSFTIPNVRAGKYNIFAFTDGVLGEYNKAEIVVEKGKPLNLGTLTWTPVRKGKQIWDVGIPNRNASEFAGADGRRDPTISIKYATLFPNDVNYVIGKSNYSKDWFFQHIPHNVDPTARPVEYSGVRSAPGRPTPYSVQFDLASAPSATGKAYLRFAICGGGARSADIEVNGKPAGKLTGLVGDGTITRHGSQGIWYEKEVDFDASLLNKGTNTLKIIIPQGPLTNGLMYDYVRLELADNAK